MILIKLMSYVRRHRVGLTALAAVCAAVCVSVGRCLPSTADGMRRSGVVVQTSSCYELRAGGRAVMWFQTVEGDTLPVGLSLSADEAAVSRLAVGCWMNRWPMLPSCRGRIVTALPDTARTPKAPAARLLAAACRRLSADVRLAEHDKAELDYYMRVHGVQDEGYQNIAAMASHRAAALVALRRTKAVADSLMASQSPLTVTRRTVCRAFVRHYGDAATDTIGCRLVATTARHHLALLQTADATTPSGVKAQYLLPWNTTNRSLLATGFGGIGMDYTAQPAARPVVVAGRRKGRDVSFPRVLTTSGTPLFTPRGLFAGIIVDGHIAGRSEVSRLLMKGGWQ